MVKSCCELLEGASRRNLGSGVYLEYLEDSLLMGCGRVNGDIGKSYNV